jgi:hypothetical protein
MHAKFKLVSAEDEAGERIERCLNLSFIIISMGAPDYEEGIRFNIEKKDKKGRRVAPVVPGPLVFPSSPNLAKRRDPDEEYDSNADMFVAVSLHGEPGPLVGWEPLNAVRLEVGPPGRPGAR